MIGGNSECLCVVGKGGSAPVTHPPSTITNFARMPILPFAALAHPILRLPISSLSSCGEARDRSTNPSDLRAIAADSATPIAGHFLKREFVAMVVSICRGRRKLSPQIRMFDDAPFH